MPHVVDNHILIPQMAALLREGKQVRFTPTGNSMRPFIEGGTDTVVLRLKNKVKVGDMCLAAIPFKANNAQVIYVLHRVIRVKGNDITLQGDGNLRGYEYCTREDILGTVETIIKPDGRRVTPRNGWVWRWLCRPRSLWLKLYRHIFIYKTLMPLKWKKH